ncbi:YdeI family protein [Dyadobacter sp. CY323]|uniref:YdeI/OmpD-associated family protein n=1 Tax=Dyadobacter sp. CY323 TaxID=2907302 RepID=UPI001F204693|nr:YdeI/OmpD-associated family protein [Dyadobacter sp. CY323]MCE6991973.1 YdeI/OmpD-associated family protein [Dyadobacter sp. CY323]
MEKEIKTFCPANKQEWREWLEKNHDKEQSVWLIYYKKKANADRLTWSDSVDEALCFGWIDSLARPLDEDRYLQFFGRRKPKSAWSRINKEKVQRLIDEGLMRQAGLDSIETAKQNGSWTILDEVEELIIPGDLEKAFDKNPEAKSHFLGLSRSMKRLHLQQLVFAKRPETRQKRIAEILALPDHKKPEVNRP